MLIEEKNVRQIPGEGPRRWFFDNYFDLIVWYDDNNEITGFQLCYDKYGSEKVLTWLKSQGYYHDDLDTGETPGQHKKTPILVADGPFDRDSTAQRFLEASEQIEEELRNLVYSKILEHRD